MRKMMIWVFGIAILAASGASYGDYSVSPRGEWPANWPKSLEPFRKQATTMVGPMEEQRFYLIPFNKREDFETVWPSLLSVKSKGAPIVLVRGPKTDFMEIKPAGVIIHAPPEGSKEPQEPLDPSFTEPRTRWMRTTYIELVVDGNIVDLNRIPLPADTPFIDQRQAPYDFRKSAAYWALPENDRKSLDQVDNDFTLLEGALERYCDDHNGAIPQSLNSLVPLYLKELPMDPFSPKDKPQTYSYRPGTPGNRAWSISSVGLSEFPYLAEKGNIGLYRAKGVWISGFNPRLIDGSESGDKQPAAPATPVGK